MAKFAIHVNPGGATFVKYYDYFVSQGGLVQDWGKHWTIIEAESMRHARMAAIRLPGARPGLYCASCGRESHGGECEKQGWEG